MIQRLFFSIFLILAITTVTVAVHAQALPLNTVASQSIYLEGYEPDGTAYRKIYLLIEQGRIQKKSLAPFAISRQVKKITEKDTGPVILSAGFIDLHNHLKYNVLPLWNEAQGQFAHRFEWRNLSTYKKQISAPLNNPLLGDSKNPESLFCQTYLYAETKALVAGVTTIQGVSQDDVCTENRLARNIEIQSDFEINTDARASTEILNPDMATFVQESLVPLAIVTEKTWTQIFNPLLAASGTVTSEASTSGTLTGRQTYFLKNLSYHHSVLDRLIPQGDMRGLIVHLAEGRQKDSYNRLEYKLAQSIGLARQGLIVIHGVGLDEDDFKHAAENRIPIVWSPFSNYRLYGETLDVRKALENQIQLSLGSDWSPSGTKNILDEVKIARRYLQKMGFYQNPQDQSRFDQLLYEMITVNPAKAIKLEDRLGRLEEGYFADIVAIDLQSKDVNPYTQIIMAKPSDIQFVMVGGKPQIATESVAQIFTTNSSKPSDALIQKSVLQHAGQCPEYREHRVIDAPVNLAKLITNLQSVFPDLDPLLGCYDPDYEQALEQAFWPVQMLPPLIQ